MDSSSGAGVERAARIPRAPVPVTRQARVRLCLLAKWPVPGRVKTRLIPALGADGAAELARAFLDDAVTSLAAHGPPLVALEGAPEDIASLPPFDRAEVVAQGGGDLGIRMVRVLACACRAAPMAAVLGSDVIGLPPSFPHDAAAALHRVDVVLGPTPDGGYYALGARREALDGLSKALEGVRFGTPSARSDTLAGLARNALRVELLAPHFDVDEPADLEVLRAHLSAHLERAPRTAALLGRRASASSAPRRET